MNLILVFKRVLTHSKIVNMDSKKSDYFVLVIVLTPKTFLDMRFKNT